jgi:hypothetical protein
VQLVYKVGRGQLVILVLEEKMVSKVLLDPLVARVILVYKALKGNRG